MPLGGGELTEDPGEGKPPDDIPGDSGPPVLICGGGDANPFWLYDILCGMEGSGMC